MRICFVSQRYGEEVNGGAEVLARVLAEKVAELTEHSVEVATTQAIDYVTWKNEYTADEDEINGIKVHRFAVVNERNQEKFNKFSEKIAAGNTTESEQEEWMRLQGPECPSLIEWLKLNRDNYDCFFFVTYLYYTTYFGLQVVADKAILASTAHDEWTIHIPMFKNFFKKPAAFYFNTIEEKALVNRLFDTSDILDNDGYGGVGVEVPDNISPEDFHAKYNIDDDFMIYVGRIDENKCCPQLFTYFREYKNRHPASNLKLVLLGKEVIKVPKADDIISLGFVSEEDKYNAIAASKFLILPSQFESLSIVVLEAMILKHPVLVNGRCNVLEGHCRRSNAGLYYKNYYEFEGCVDYLLTREEKVKIMGHNGVRYVEDNYSWKSIVERLDGIIHKIHENK